MEAAMLVESDAMTSLVDTTSSSLVMIAPPHPHHHHHHAMNLVEIEMHADVITSSLNEEEVEEDQEESDAIPQLPRSDSSRATQVESQAIPKRRRSVLTLEQKLEIIKRIKEGEKITKLAVEYGVGKATVSDLKRKEDKITAFVSKMSASTGGTKRKTMRRPNDERIEKALHMWISRERNKGTHISGPLLMEKAKSFHKQLYGEDDDKFKASTGWLHRFKVRNGIRHQKTMSAKRKTLDTTTDETNLQIQLETLRRFIHDNCIGPEQIYTANKTRLHWRALPFKTTSSEATNGSSKDCIQVVGCVNATGTHKLRLAVIGHSDSTFLFENVNVNKMPFQFHAKDNGKMDAEIFAEWFHKEFVSSVRSYYRGAGLPARALLLVDDSVPLPYGDNGNETLLQSEDGAIRCIGVTSATSFVTHPINGKVFDTMKRVYRKKLVSRVLSVVPIGRKVSLSTIDIGKYVTLKDVGYMLSEAWSMVQSETIRRLWKDTLYCLGAAVDEQAVVVDELLKKVDDNGLSYNNGDSMCSLVEDSFKITELLKDYEKNVSEEDVANWLSMDGEDARNGISLSDRDIIETVRFEVVGSESEDEGFENTVKTKRKNQKKGGGGGGEQSSVSVPSDVEAYSCFTKCLLWLECQSDCEPAHLQLLWKLQNVAAQKKRENKRLSN